jgi:hypothetical protein
MALNPPKDKPGIFKKYQSLFFDCCFSSILFKRLRKQEQNAKHITDFKQHMNHPAAAAFSTLNPKFCFQMQN